MSFGDRYLDNALDRWLTTDPFDGEDEDQESWYGCPQQFCSYEGNEAEMSAHVAAGEHNQEHHPDNYN